MASAREQASPEAIYRARADAFTADALVLGRRFNRVANVRLLAFLATAACLIWAVAQGGAPAAGLGLAFGAVFVGLVRYHRQLGRQRDHARGMRDVNVESMDRLARRWETIPLRHTVSANPRHPFAADLDLLGRASLLHLLDTTRTAMGQSTLTRWLLEPAGAEEVGARQAAMAELSSKLDLRQELQVSAGPEDVPRLDPQPLLTWAESRPERLRPAQVWCARISPVLLGVCAIAEVTGRSSWPVWLVFLFVNLVLWQLFGRRAYTTLAYLADQEPALRQYAASFDLLTTATFEAPRLAALQASLHANGRSAAAQIHSLERIARRVIPRSALAYWVVQPLTLWDVQVLAALEDWQATVGPCLRRWLEALGEIEALAALAALAHAHPDWAIPHIDASACRLEASRAGHPLLAPDTRVDNDVSLGPSGTCVLVTGSNMAGKSTYLRTIGVNVVLAQAGGPVCARAFRMPPLDLCTSMRVVDSLERGVSTFLAEVMRLKQIVDVARQAAGERTVCYLLDEILQGTNSAERQIAVRQVIRFLVARQAIGAVSTHDLTLADLPEFDTRARLVHFQETLSDGPDGPVMSFGYQLQPGLATSTNALRLVAMLGLDDDST
ncbi:MAG: hypothetical protein JO057_11810 [Chloroflexi bacterium]|nr:hypothetical protein [Chloroflexota bacterium]